MSILITTKYGEEGRPKTAVDRRAVFSTAEPITCEFSDSEGEEVEWTKAPGQNPEEDEDEPIDYRFGSKPPKQKQVSDDGVDYEELYKQAKNEAESLNDRVEGLCEIIDSGEKEIEQMQSRIFELENQLTEAQQRRRKSSVSATVEAARRAAETKSKEESQAEETEKKEVETKPNGTLTRSESVDKRKETSPADERRVSGAVRPTAETLGEKKESPVPEKEDNAEEQPSSPRGKKDTKKKEEKKVDKRDKKESKVVLLDGVVKEGYLVKQGKVVRNWKSRWFVLMEGALNYYTNQEKKHLKRSIPITSIMSCRVDPKLSTRFYIHTKDRVFKCVTGDQSDRKDWAMKINKALLSSIEKFMVDE